MGVDIYWLQPGTEREIRIGGGVHTAGVIRRLWKMTETGLLPSRIEAVETLKDAQHARKLLTPRAVVVDNPTLFGGQDELEAYQVLGWDAGRVKTQDLDWDHLPTLGWAIDSGCGPLVLHEEVSGRLVPMIEARALELGILRPDGQLAEHHLPTIIECRSIRDMGEGYYDADCTLDSGQAAHVLGESEGGELPDATWFVGRNTGEAARYSLKEQVSGRR